MSRLKYIFVIGAYAIVTYLGSWTANTLTDFALKPKLKNLPSLDIKLQEEIEEQKKGNGHTSVKENRVLVFSSVGRSGSSFLGQLVAKMPRSVYIFEPLMYLQQKTKEGVTAASATGLLEDIYNCKFNSKWLYWASRQGKILYNPTLNDTCRGNQTFLLKCLMKACREGRNKVMKVIRIRASWAQTLLSTDPSLKVIHIVRDPRASFTSLVNLNMAQKNFTEWCPKIQEDLELVRSLETSFPNSYLFLKYEDLCLDSEGTTLKIWRFLSGSNDSNLPDSMRAYLDKHTRETSKGSFTTSRNSTKEVNSWRWEINERILLGVEHDCSRALEVLGYAKFGSLANATNSSLSFRI